MAKRKKLKETSRVESATEMVERAAREMARLYGSKPRPPAPIEPAPGTPLTKVMTPAQIAKKFGVSSDTIVRRIESGKLPVVKWSDRGYQIPVALLPHKSD